MQIQTPQPRLATLTRRSPRRNPRHVPAEKVARLHAQAGAITATEIAAGAVTADKIAAGEITADKLSVSDLSSIASALGSVSVGFVGSSFDGITFLTESSGSVTIRSYASGILGLTNNLRIGGYIDMSEDPLIGQTTIQLSATTIDISGTLDVNAINFSGGDVSLGAADSGGPGFRVLRVPN